MGDESKIGLIWPNTEINEFKDHSSVTSLCFLSLKCASVFLATKF